MVVLVPFAAVPFVAVVVALVAQELVVVVDFVLAFKPGFAILATTMKGVGTLCI